MRYAFIYSIGDRKYKNIAACASFDSDVRPH